MRKLRSALLVMILFGLLSVTAAQANSYRLTNNSGSGSQVFFIEGEPTLVLNGFDLTPTGLTGQPLQLDAVSIDIAVPAGAIEAVVYQDADGGSPANAVLLDRQSIAPGQGVTRVFFDDPQPISAPVLWAGFYMPPGTEFRADTQGNSVLTYWAWTPGGGVDLNNLTTAGIIGPGDGSEPVNIAMGGVARITLDLSVPITNEGVQASVPLGQPITSAETPDFSIMQQYEFCGEDFAYDTQDVTISGENAFTLACRVDPGPYSPPDVANRFSDRSVFDEYVRRGHLYEVIGRGNYQRDTNDSEKLRVPVTHCVRPAAEDIERAVIANSYGVPRAWHLLPTVRYGEVVCAEVTHVGFVSYFVPAGPEVETLANLTFAREPITTPNPLECGVDTFVAIHIINDGTEHTGKQLKVLVEDTLVRTGEIVETRWYHFPPLAPGETYVMRSQDFVGPSVYIDELHRLVFTIDFDDQLNETNETDNVYTIDYILKRNPDHC